MKTSDFDYNLPPELIAQSPVAPRDHSRLMVINRITQTITHDYFYNLHNYLNSNDLLVFNQSRVIPARLFGEKITGGKVEILLVKKLSPNTWECMTKPGLKVNQEIIFSQSENSSSQHLQGKIIKINDNGLREVEFNLMGEDFTREIEKIGAMPTPPYITKPIDSNDQYQTIYAKEQGSVAAPTAGFHFTEKLFEKLDQKEIAREFLTLHVGLGTFKPVKTENIEQHEMHSEWFTISNELAHKLNQVKSQGKRIITVGTTSTRALESACEITNGKSAIQPFTGETNIFIYPGYQWKFVDAMITNFHLPKSTLIMLVASIMGLELTKKAYSEAVDKKYRFYSFGDGMLIV